MDILIYIVNLGSMKPVSHKEKHKTARPLGRLPCFRRGTESTLVGCHIYLSAARLEELQEAGGAEYLKFLSFR